MTLSSFPVPFRALLMGAVALALVSCGDHAAVAGHGAHVPDTGAVTGSTLPSIPATAMRPENGMTVGVAMPVILRLGADVAPRLRQQVTDHIRVTSVPPVRGAWHWFAPNEVHWRPATYWSPGTQVAVTADLGRDHWWQTFTIGPKHTSFVDTVRHRMRVYDGERLIATWPLSAGRRDLQTIDGTLYVRYKNQDVLMDSESIGIPREAWDGYYEHVFWNTAVSTDGYYVHGAPWSLSSQGVTNVSHGCINLSPEHAETFYNFSRVGDIVVVRGSSKPATSEDGEGDWQMSFVQFARGSEAPRTVF